MLPLSLSYVNGQFRRLTWSVCATALILAPFGTLAHGLASVVPDLSVKREEDA